MDNCSTARIESNICKLKQWCFLVELSYSALEKAHQAVKEEVLFTMTDKKTKYLRFLLTLWKRSGLLSYHFFDGTSLLLWCDVLREHYGRTIYTSFFSKFLVIIKEFICWCSKESAIKLGFFIYTKFLLFIGQAFWCPETTIIENVVAWSKGNSSNGIILVKAGLKYMPEIFVGMIKTLIVIVWEHYFKRSYHYFCPRWKVTEWW